MRLNHIERFDCGVTDRLLFKNPVGLVVERLRVVESCTRDTLLIAPPHTNFWSCL